MTQFGDNFRPKPRPHGFNSNDRPTPNRSNRPYRAPQRPAPPPRVRKPKGPSQIVAKKPASGKQRRRMLKAAAWRLAKQLHAKPSDIMASGVETLEQLIDARCEKRVYGSNRGDAFRLMEKILRLRRPAKA